MLSESLNCPSKLLNGIIGPSAAKGVNNAFFPPSLLRLSVGCGVATSSAESSQEVLLANSPSPPFSDPPLLCDTLKESRQVIVVRILSRTLC